jgi:hypothetical protein
MWILPFITLTTLIFFSKLDDDFPFSYDFQKKNVRLQYWTLVQ